LTILKKKLIQEKVIILLLIGLYVFFGYLRTGYLINFGYNHHPLIINRNSNLEGAIELIRNKKMIQSFSNPIVVSGFFYLAVFAILSLLIIFFVFRKREYALYTIWVYLSLVIVVMSFSLLAYIFPFTSELTGQIKDLMVTPFLPCFLVAYYYFLEHSKK